MQMSFTESTRRTMKWYKKLFFHLLDVAVYNSYVLFQEVKKEKVQLREYRLKLIKKIATKYVIPSRFAARPRNQSFLRLTERHFSLLIAEGKRRRCYVCSQTTCKPRQVKKTRYECSSCNVGLCIWPCFEEFHTLTNF